jgi:hypothetical protein
VFENGLLRKTSVLKRDNITGSWRKLHNEELHNLVPALIILIIIYLEISKL